MLRDERYGSWLRVPRPNPGAALKLICFPYAGGNASLVQSWHTRLPDYVEVYGVQLPGRANRIGEPPFINLPALVAELAKVLMTAFDRPFAFFGHSMGAILSFELARRLQAHGHTLPRHLFVSGRRAPQIPDTDTQTYQKNDEEFLSRLNELNGTQTEILSHPELLRLMLPTLRADFEMAETYKYIESAPLACPITAFGGADDNESIEGKLKGWCVQTSSRFSHHLFEGGHFFINSHQNQFLDVLRAELLGIDI